jgi:hypothetical protein
LRADWKPEGPEFVIVNPKRAEGWLDEEVMGRRVTS